MKWWSDKNIITKISHSDCDTTKQFMCKAYIYSKPVNLFSLKPNVKKSNQNFFKKIKSIVNTLRYQNLLLLCVAIIVCIIVYSIIHRR